MVGDVHAQEGSESTQVRAYTDETAAAAAAEWPSVDTWEGAESKVEAELRDYSLRSARPLSQSKSRNM